MNTKTFASSWRSWVGNELEPSGPGWHQWLWTTLFAAGIALVFTLIGLAVASSKRPDLWLDGALWIKYYRVNFFVSFAIAALIHVMFVVAIAWVGAARIRAFTDGRKALFFSAIPIAGVLIGWPAAVWLVSQQGIGWVRISTVEVGSSVVLGGVISFFIYLVFSARAQRALAEKRAAEAQLRLLQAQMEPHFLFNTLASVLTLIDIEPQRAKLMLESFTDYLRATLTNLRQTQGTLDGELGLAEAYLRLMQLRMEDRLQLRIEAGDDARAAALPPLLLQPLVENAIHHGLEPSLQGGTVTVHAQIVGPDLLLTVCDDGVGLDAPRKRQGNGMALDNIRQRLQALYGEAASLTVSPLKPGTCATLRLPCTRSPA